MSDAGEPRESAGGRLWILITLLVSFVAPVWMMLTAGIVQVFPEWVGTEVVLLDDFTVVERTSTLGWMVASTGACVLVGGLFAVLGLVGAVGWVADLIGGRVEARRARRYADLAGDAVLSDTRLESHTLDTSVSPQADAT